MTANEVHEALRQKLRDRWCEYSAEVLECPAEVIFERADEISAAKFCYDQLTEYITSYPIEDLEYLLRFQDPLSVVQDQWAAEQNVDCSEEFRHALWVIQDTRAAEQDYALDPAWMPRQDGPSMC